MKEEVIKSANETYIEDVATLAELLLLYNDLNGL